MGSKYVSSSVIKRLPRYYRFLGYLMEDGMVRISSRELAERMGLSASQIRQDLNNFGGFGQQGYGYNIESLYTEIGKILGVDSGFKTILVGAGNLGHTIALQIEYEKRGFDLIGIFDKKESLSGQMINGIPIRHSNDIEDFCKDNGVKVAILCVPYDAAKELVPTLVKSGVIGFWNFSHYNINEEYPNVSVENVHLNDSLMTLCYQVLHENN
ncbi:MAG: redox-sensing transcriptional repressor Rex [Clostridia bacterium]|nr:redox-sensing transcriptional repressor Rex [Clostridia bacterium]